jgi:hypothetical protein
LVLDGKKIMWSRNFNIMMESLKAVPINILMPMLSVVAILGFFSTGAYYTGETARAAMYVVPPLLVLVAISLETIEAQNMGRFKYQLLGLVFGQTLIMQIFGFWLW